MSNDLPFLIRTVMTTHHDDSPFGDTPLDDAVTEVGQVQEGLEYVTRFDRFHVGRPVGELAHL